MSPNISVAAPPVDTAAIGAAMRDAIQHMTVVTRIGNREFLGVLREAEAVEGTVR
jgi:hypothetical protein